MFQKDMFLRINRDYFSDLELLLPERPFLSMPSELAMANFLPVEAYRLIRGEIPGGEIRAWTPPSLMSFDDDGPCEHT
jgi:hypothetical protein